MFKIILSVFLFLSGNCLCGQVSQPQKQISTLKFAGEYAYGSSAEKEEVGFASIYAESDSTILFYLDLNAGSPSLSMGAIYGRAKIKNATGLFATRIGSSEDSCQFSFKFKSNKLILQTLNGQYNCGFGHRVFVDGTFKRISKKNPAYFLNQETEKIYFKELKL